MPCSSITPRALPSGQTRRNVSQSSGARGAASVVEWSFGLICGKTKGTRLLHDCGRVPFVICLPVIALVSLWLGKDGNHETALLIKLREVNDEDERGVHLIIPAEDERSGAVRILALFRLPAEHRHLCPVKCRHICRARWGKIVFRTRDRHAVKG